MITPEIKSYDCSDHDPIDKYIPEDPSDVYFSMNFSIGMPGNDGADNFQVDVFTTKSIKRISEKKTHSIVLDKYSWTLLLDEVNSILKQCQGDNWESISSQLSKHFFWEFQDYRPYK